MENINQPQTINAYWRAKSLEYYYKNKDAINAKRRAKRAAQVILLEQPPTTPSVNIK